MRQGHDPPQTPDEVLHDLRRPSTRVEVQRYNKALRHLDVAFPVVCQTLGILRHTATLRE